jgi:3'-5' exoribonuclease
MKSPYVSELQPNQVFTATFLVQSKEIRQKKTGEPYLSLQLSDRTGEVDAKMWDNVADIMETFERDDFVKIRGLLQIYQNRRQVTLHKLQRIAESDIDVADYFPASDRSPAAMFADVEAIIAGIQNPHIHALLSAIFADPEIAVRFRTAPAAKSVHHAYLGGLIEHVLSICSLCRTVGAHYKNIDMDLLLAGAILHDIGKIFELTYDRSFGYSSEGQLLGHIVIALRIIDDKICRIEGFPVKLRTLLEHMILSHHGTLEFGSPKVPLFPEALLLHHLDNLDSKMEAMRYAIQRDRLLDGCWTGYLPSLERMVLNKAKFFETAVSAPLETAVPPPVAPQPAEVVVQQPPAPEPVADGEFKRTPLSPPPPVAPAAVSQRRQTGVGFFAEKLQNALRGTGSPRSRNEEK